jgi:hypothetical protein
MYRSRSPSVRTSNYTPYKDAPPRSKVIRGGRSSSRSIVSSRTRSPRSKSRSLLRTGRRKRKATRNMENIEMIDYGDAYNTPDAYYVKEGNYGKVYRCPKPK